MGNNKSKKRAKQGRRVRPDGTVFYYYHKRKNGHPKKRGPKKKIVEKPKKIRTWAPWDYTIIRFDLKKKKKYIGRYHTIEDAYAKKEELEKLNSEVVFPKETIINYRNSDEPYDLRSEYLILKKNKNEEDASLLRNDYGRFVEHTIDDKEWIIYDKFPCIEEETFWAYGYNARTDRKDFNWIYENFITDIITDTYNIVIVYLYNNKVIFRYDNKEFNFVICKNISDAIRMYNLIAERSKKSKQVIMSGSCRGYDYRGKEAIEMIKEKTGWTYKKIWERSTRH